MKNKNYAWLIDVWAGACFYNALKLIGVFNNITICRGHENENLLSSIFVGVFAAFVFFVGFIISHYLRRKIYNHCSSNWLKYLFLTLWIIICYFIMVLPVIIKNML
jgi:quinol-cytochrome oxidoreductase complex cytochrome b subunit